jgi:hypothetical protein
MHKKNNNTDVEVSAVAYGIFDKNMNSLIGNCSLTQKKMPTIKDK